MNARTGYMCMIQSHTCRQKFDRHRDYETFEYVWRNVLEFKEKSDKASRECGQKIRPSNIKWTRKDREALK